MNGIAMTILEQLTQRRHQVSITYTGKDRNGFRRCFNTELGETQLLPVSAIPSAGKRTVTSALCVMGMSDDLSFARYHHVLSRPVWQPLEDHPYPAPARLFKKGLTQLLNISYC